MAWIPTSSGTASLDHPFRLIGIDHVYLTPGSERHIDAHPDLGRRRRIRASCRTSRPKGWTEGEIVVYDVTGPRLRNITSTYAALPREREGAATGGRRATR